MKPRNDAERARQVRRVVGYAMIQAELRKKSYVVVPEPPPTEIHREENDMPYYVEEKDATAWEKANGQLVKPGDA